jgi:dihydrofolate synthase/folylpolyglutamate synthase
VADKKRVGTFTSPEVYSYNENFCIDGIPLADEKLCPTLQKAYDLAQTMQDKPTAFEIETAAALCLFAEEGCDYAVIECGMGGLNDSTNAIAQKEVAVVTSIGLEHTAILGDTIAKICAQKAGIFCGCPAVVSACQTQEAREFFSALSVRFAGDGIELLNSNSSGQTFAYHGNSYQIHMIGTPQLYNAATAIEVAKILSLSQTAIEEGLSNTILLGRVERIERGDVTYVLDGSHNPQSFTPLLEWGRQNGVDSLIYGCLSDKDIESVASILCQLTCRIVVVSPPSYRAMGQEDMVQTMKRHFKVVQSEESIANALERAEGKHVVVCGSFTMLKEAKQWIEKRH